MVNKPVELDTTIKINVEKPIAGMFYIRDKYLRLARDKNKTITLVYKNKKYVATYKQWMKGAKKMTKEFLIPGNPMVLYGNYFMKFKTVISTNNYDNHEINIIRSNTLMSMPEKYRRELKIKLGLIKL